MTRTRLLAGLIGLAVILPIVFFGGPSGTAVVVAIALIISLDEYARMAFPETPKAAMGALMVGMAGLLLPAVAGAGAGPTLAGLAWVVLGAGVVVVVTGGSAIDRAADLMSRALWGVMWVGMLTFLIRLRHVEDGIVWVMVVLGIAWAADTGAYFAGRHFGRRKMAPVISPNKTWEGFVGGLLGSMVWVGLVEVVAMPEVSWARVCLLAPVASAMGVLGDLTESLLKRSHGIKDTGQILPGHGGLLDRIDSVLFVAPVVWSWHVVGYGV